MLLSPNENRKAPDIIKSHLFSPRFWGCYITLLVHHLNAPYKPSMSQFFSKNEPHRFSGYLWITELSSTRPFKYTHDTGVNVPFGHFINRGNVESDTHLSCTGCKFTNYDYEHCIIKIYSLFYWKLSNFPPFIIICWLKLWTCACMLVCVYGFVRYLLRIM